MGWISRHGHPLRRTNSERYLVCPESGLRYREKAGELKCIDVGEEEALPIGMRTGTLKYRNYK